MSIQGQPLPPQSFEADTDVKDDLQTFNWGFTGGGGIDYVLHEKHKFLLDIKGAYGFIPIQKDTETNGKSHTGGVIITIGYMITLRGGS